jgi:ElaB/YqjD/DUF883 family membrane-anchored ribosome-binding protein
MTQATTRTERERLLDEFDAVVTETEELLKSMSGAGGDATELSSAMRARLEQNLRDAKERLQRLEEYLVRQTRIAARAADDYVHENPWRAVGIAAGIGFLLGLLISRR